MSIPSFMSDMQTVFGLSSNYASEFRAYLGLSNTQAIPNTSVVANQYLQFLSAQENSSLAAFFLANIQKIYGGTSDVDYLTLVDEFHASLGISSESSLEDSPATRQQFMYFLSSPLTLTANALLGISTEAADSLFSFRNGETNGPITDTATTASDYLEWLPTFLRDNEGQGSTPDANILLFIENTLLSFNKIDATDPNSFSTVFNTLAKFRAYLGLSNSEAIPNDTAARAAFLMFLQENQATIQKSEAVNAISPQEQEIRNAIFATYSIILKMLSVLQRASQVEAKSQEIYADWMSSITDQISSTPMYGPTDQNKIVANSADFGKTTLGYGNITVRDVLSYLMNQIQTNNSTDETFTVSNPTVQNLDESPSSTSMGFPKFELQKNSDGSFTFSIEAPTGTDDQGVPTGWTTLLSAQVPASTSLITNQSSTSALVESLLTQMTTAWNETSSIITPEIAFWTPTRTSSTGGALTSGTGWVSTVTTIDIKKDWTTGIPIYAAPTTTVVPEQTCANVYYQWVSDGESLPNWNRLVTNNINTVVSAMMPSFESGSCDAVSTTLLQFSNGLYTNKYMTLTLEKDPSSTTASGTFKLYWSISSTDYGNNNITANAYDAAQAAGDHCGAATLGTTGSNVFTTTATQTSMSTGLWGPWESAWPDTVAYSSDTDFAASLQSIEATAQTYRGEVNAQLQLYLQSTQARQSNIETSMKNMQNLVSQTTQAVTNMINTLDTFMQTLTSILSALFH